jgi:hypothetical protein
VGLGFELQVTVAGIVAVIVFECPLDIHRMRHGLNEIGVVAVQRPHEVGKRRKQGRRQAVAEAGGLLGEVERKVRQRSAVPGRMAGLMSA